MHSLDDLSNYKKKKDQTYSIDLKPVITATTNVSANVHRNITNLSLYTDVCMYIHILTYMGIYMTIFVRQRQM